MKRILSLIILIAFMLSFAGCTKTKNTPQIAATTLPVYEFTRDLCAGTGISVAQVVTEDVSCLHDYTLQVRQMQILEGAELVILSGAGLESFLEDELHRCSNVIDASEGIALHCEEDSVHHQHDDHHHEQDPHYWLSPANARQMCKNILTNLQNQYPQHAETFQQNWCTLEEKFNHLDAYGVQLSQLKSRELITFHDGFSYLAEAYDLHILKAIEEESGSEASAAELIELCNLVATHQLPAIFTEKNGSTSAATIISAQTGARSFSLDMAISGESYFTAMRNNIDTLKEALG